MTFRESVIPNGNNEATPGEERLPSFLVDLHLPGAFCK